MSYKKITVLYPALLFNIEEGNNNQINDLEYFNESSGNIGNINFYEEIPHIFLKNLIQPEIYLQSSVVNNNLYLESSFYFQGEDQELKDIINHLDLEFKNKGFKDFESVEIYLVKELHQIKIDSLKEYTIKINEE